MFLFFISVEKKHFLLVKSLYLLVECFVNQICGWQVQYVGEKEVPGWKATLRSLALS